MSSKPEDLQQPDFLIQRALMFVLASTSILSLLTEFYGLASMKLMVAFVFVPASILMMLWVLCDLADERRREFAQMVCMGAMGGFVASIVYDLYRVPFVLTGMPIFKVFAEFGTLISGLPKEHWGAHATGWLYHFSNGITFGIMYVMLAWRRDWRWAIAWGVFLEIMMLVTPYAKMFGLHMTPKFLFVTLSAHLFWGITLGLYLRAKK